MTTVLITGGAGFIGRWLVRHALNAGAVVVVYDNLSVGSLENLMEMEGNFAFYQGDIRDQARLSQVLRKHAVERVFHLAALHYIPYCESHPQETYEVNLVGTLAVLEAMRAASVRRLVFASTGALYPPLDTPLTEETPLEPQDIYGLTKLHCEQAIQYYQKRYGIEATIVRLFNTYGPYETNPHLLPHIIQTLKQGVREIPLGNLKPKRDYVYVTDVAEGFWRLGESPATVGVYNLGTGVEHSVEEVVATLSELLRMPIQIVQDPTRVRPVDKLHQRADLERLRAALRWTPSTSLTQGLRHWLAFEGLLGQRCG
jgi:UDP-glucose 4-epimerase